MADISADLSNVVFDYPFHSMCINNNDDFYPIIMKVLGYFVAFFILSVLLYVIYFFMILPLISPANVVLDGA